MNEVIFEGKFTNLHFYPGNGAEQNDTIIRLYTAWGRDFCVLLDGDKAGQKAKQRYLNEVGPAVEGRLLTLADIEPLWTGATENLFSERDRIEITQKYKPSAIKFEKSPFYTAILNLWSDKEAFNFEKETLENFHKLFTSLSTPIPSNSVLSV
jgi:hypothetical protein